MPKLIISVSLMTTTYRRPHRPAGSPAEEVAPAPIEETWVPEAVGFLVTIGT